MELLEKYAFELLIGALGYNIRKYFGEQISKYILHPIMKKLKKYIFSPIWKWIKTRTITSQREAAIFLHYRNKAHRKGHQHKNPMICEDDRCRLI